MCQTLLPQLPAKFVYSQKEDVLIKKFSRETVISYVQYETAAPRHSRIYPFIVMHRQSLFCPCPSPLHTKEVKLLTPQTLIDFFFNGKTQNFKAETKGRCLGLPGVD